MVTRSEFMYKMVKTSKDWDVSIIKDENFEIPENTNIQGDLILSKSSKIRF